jgi:hypothetical protein
MGDELLPLEREPEWNPESEWVAWLEKGVEPAPEDHLTALEAVEFLMSRTR